VWPCVPTELLSGTARGDDDAGSGTGHFRYYLSDEVVEGFTKALGRRPFASGGLFSRLVSNHTGGFGADHVSKVPKLRQIALTRCDALLRKLHLMAPVEYSHTMPSLT
jgi:hypothetical protein